MTGLNADSAGDTFVLAVMQHEPTPLDINASVERLDAALESAAAAGSNLLLAPECSLTGYNISREDAERIALESCGDSINKVAALCRSHGVALTIGYIERDADQLFNTAMLIDRHGVTQAHYRKTHLWAELDRALFSAGERFSPIVKIDGWMIGVLICYDIEFPESVRHLSLAGAEIVLTPTALMAPWNFVARAVVPVRAAESQVFVGYANYCGRERDINYVGHSCIVDPSGAELARAGDTPELLQATLQRHTLQSIRQDLPYLSDRRPALYGAPS